MKLTIIFVSLAMLLVETSLAQQLIQIRWPSTQASAPVSFSELSSEFTGIVRLGLATFSEETIISTSLRRGQALGLDPAHARQLRGLFSSYYSRIRKTRLFKDAPSALPYCYSERKPAEGLATVYLPAKISNPPKTIVFLHGYGGSLLAFIHYLVSTFPDHIIICPAYGISGANVPYAYIAEAAKAVATRVKVDLGKPLLMGLSAGAYGACRLYSTKPEPFRRLICIAAYPPPESMPRFNRAMDICFVCGGKESYVADGSFRRQMLAIQQKARSLDWKIIDGAGHFFILSHEQQTRKVLQEWEKP